jgi:hypothetical protein
VIIKIFPRAAAFLFIILVFAGILIIEIVVQPSPEAAFEKSLIIVR